MRLWKSFSAPSASTITIIAFALLQIPIVIYALISTDHWQDSMDALRGEYTQFGISANPWEDLIPDLAGFTLVNIFFSWAALRIVKYIKLESHFYLWRRYIGIFFAIIAAFFYWLLLLFSSYSWTYFVDDYFFPGPVISPPIINFLTLTVFIINFILILRTKNIYENQTENT